VSSDDRSVYRLLLTGAVALALVGGGTVIGATLWPRMVTVEQHVIAPAVRAVARNRDADTVPDLIDAACPAVVAIEPQRAPVPAPTPKHARKGKPKLTPQDEPPARLAGFIVSADGSVLTSTAFLPEEGALFVLLNDGRRLEAARVGTDAASGLALLKLSGSDFPSLPLAGEGFPRTGEWALALSTPFGSGCVAAPGLVSADFVAEQGRQRSYVRVAPALATALAGAPVIGADGQVMGMAGLGVHPPGEAAPNSPPSPDASMLLPASAMARVLSELLRNGQTAPNPLGLYADDLAPGLANRLGLARQRGAVVTMVTPGSPADRAGVRAGDVIVSVGGAPIAGASELARALDAGGGKVQIDVTRQSDRLTFTLISEPDAD